MGLLTLLLIVVGLTGATLLISYGCFRFAFYAGKRKPNHGEVELPDGEVYVPYHDVMTRWVLEARALKSEDVSIVSRDGLKLTGKFYEYAPGAPMELMFHGYRGAAERDMSGGVQRAFRVGRSALVVEQRCSNTSEGDVITFGIMEHLDCLDWVDFAIDHYGKDVKIILTGISMGAPGAYS